ncbi:MAG: MATE family efflux transporter, partial [Syntrophomonadaceae bacterium]|nr:MATE family efflux transporter [Syntrophomonadaceae bacterium]
GDSKSPLIAQFIGGLVNVAMDAVFLKVFEDGVSGVAWATLISQTIAALYVVWRLTKLDDEIALKLRDIGIDKPILCDVLKMGVPAGAQSLLITLSNVMAQYQINSLDIDAIAAFTAYFKVELILYLPIVAFGQAIMTFSGQNIGAGNLKRMCIGTRECLIIACCITAVCSVMAIAFGSQLFRIFNKEPEVIALGVQIISVTFPFYFVYNFLQILGDSIRGAGKTQPPMFIVMVNICIIRTILLFILVPGNPNVRSVAVTYPITWALAGACMAVYYFLRQKQLKWELDASVGE